MPRPSRDVVRPERWSARVCSETDIGRGLFIAEVAAVFRVTRQEAMRWAVWELERLRPEAIDGCCYTVQVNGPGLSATGYLFSPGEPIDWTICRLNR